MGIVAPWDIEVTITGDESLQKRPMRRIVAPLAKMGVDFKPETPETLPITVCGNRALRAIDYASPMASAQLKTAVLLAGVFADGTTTVNEPAPSRNHTELMLPEFNVPTTAGTRVATVTGPAEMLASDVVVPGDPSSAAFVAAAALLKPGSSVTIQNVSLNPARIGFVRTLERMGADIRESYGGHEGKEPRGTITVNYTPVLRGCEIPSQHIASVIDEIPVLALVAAHARGITVFHEVGELRVKESDRLKAIIDGLALLGVDAWEEGDDLFVEGNPQLQVPQGLVFESYGDHRLAMTWALVGACGPWRRALQNGVALDDEPALGAIARTYDIAFGHVEGDPVPRRVFIGDDEVTDAIRTAEIDRAVSPVSAAPAVREALLDQQRRIGNAGDYVVEGRDIGTVVFPDAAVKVFLTASDEERAHRRVRQNVDRGIGSIDYDEVLADLRRRDEADSSRATAPLRPADDAVHIDSTSHYIEEVIDQICSLAREAR